MKITSATVTFLIGSVGVGVLGASDTENFCVNDIPDLQRIKPSETGLDIDPIPNITIGDVEYDGNADHFISLSDPSPRKAMVVLHGTTGTPESMSCLIKSVSESVPYPTIGLRYSFLSDFDAGRNEKCATLPLLSEQVECLEKQHRDAVDGGDYGATHFTDDGEAFWEEVDPANSMTARLGKLLIRLGWSDLVRPTGEPKWSKLAFVGFSQGSGHAAYLAQTRKTLGAGVLSGPQDECIGCPEGTLFWIDGGIDGIWETENAFTAVAHSNEEAFDAAITDNWNRIYTAGTTSWSTDNPADVGFALDEVFACNAPLVTSVLPALTSRCGRTEHCSTSIDHSVPVIESTTGDIFPIYAENVWPAIARAESCRRAAKTSKSRKF